MNQNQDIIFEIKNRLDIVSIISEYVVLKKSGRNFWGLCPFHQEKTSSFSVNPDKGIFKCFGCGEGGDAISFLQKINKNSFIEVISDLAQKFGIALPSYGYSPEKNELKDKIYEINLKAAQYYNKLLLEQPEGKQAKEYLFKRQIDREIIEKFNIGYSPKQADGLVNYLIDNFKADFDLLNKAGLVSERSSKKGYCDRFRNRIMIPIQDDKGNIIAFGGRSLDDSQHPKYLNSPDTLVFNKSRSLFALYQAKDSIKNIDSVVIMEGYFDAISAHTHGLTNVVATLGTALTESHIKILARYTESRRIYLAFDSDEAGINATSRGAEIIKTVFAGLGDIKQFDENFADNSSNDSKFACEVRVVSTTTGKDPDEFIKTEGIEAYKKLINQAPLLLDYQINTIIKSKGNINTPQDKMNLVNELIPVLAEIKNSVIRDEYIRLVGEKLDINEESLKIELKKTLQNKPTKKQAFSPIVNKKLEKHFLAQKNLLSFYFINSDNIPILCINNYLKEVNFTGEDFLLIKTNIEQIIQETDDTQELIDRLLAALADNDRAKQIVIDMLFSLDDKKNLDERLLKQYIQENILCINQYHSHKEQENLKLNYRSAKDDEITSLELQYQVKELVQFTRNRLESINE